MSHAFKVGQVVVLIRDEDNTFGHMGQVNVGKLFTIIEYMDDYKNYVKIKREKDEPPFYIYKVPQEYLRLSIKDHYAKT